MIVLAEENEAWNVPKMNGFLKLIYTCLFALFLSMSKASYNFCALVLSYGLGKWLKVQEFFMLKYDPLISVQTAGWSHDSPKQNATGPLLSSWRFFTLKSSSVLKMVWSVRLRGCSQNNHTNIGMLRSLMQPSFIHDPKKLLLAQLTQGEEYHRRGERRHYRFSDTWWR